MHGQAAGAAGDAGGPGSGTAATPFFLKGSGYDEGKLFPWVVSDFGLIDAIESGLVKVPRVPVADDAMSPQGPTYRKQGCRYGYTRVRGGNAGSARGAKSFVAETVSRLRTAGATGEMTVRADSAFYSKAMLWACRTADVRFSVVCDRNGSTLTLEADHRAHAQVELVIRDLKAGPLAHLPSGVFTANAAWAVLAAVAHNVGRQTLAAAGRDWRPATVATLRRKLVALPARLVSSAGDGGCAPPPAGRGSPRWPERSPSSQRSLRPADPPPPPCPPRPQRPSAGTPPGHISTRRNDHNRRLNDRQTKQTQQMSHNSNPTRITESARCIQAKP